ncbi:MAG: helix-turn-helix domain-containing protein [Lachnospirales bacterium]
MSKVSENLGIRIRSFRKKQGISQEELAFKSSISTTYLGQIERAEKSPTVEVLDKLANALEISIYDLFLFDEEIKTQNNNTTLNKINAQLSTLSEKEQAEVLKLIKNVKAFKNL